MNTKQTMIWGGLLMAALLIYTAAVYPALPARMPIHWNIRGEPDGWADKQIAVLMMPGTMLLLLALVPALPALSPRNYKIEPFLPTFNYLMLIVSGLMGYIHLIMIQAALNPKLDFAKVMMIGIYLMFALMGNVLGKTRRNFFMGIRTPWTLANDDVWIATHRLGGRVFVAGGVLGVLLTCLGMPQTYSFAFLMVLAFIPVIYSYIYYKQIDAGTP
jgi:uncharacterized membrane protein